MHSQAGLELWEVRANRTKMQGTALTALEPLVFPRISTGPDWTGSPTACDGLRLLVVRRRREKST